jgi:hypothetical protein
MRTVNASLSQSYDIFVIAITKMSYDCERIQRVFYNSLFRMRKRY